MAQSLASSPLFCLLTFAFFAVDLSTVDWDPKSIRALVAPISKDGLTSLYFLSLHHNTSLLVDLTAPLSWSRCPAVHPTIPCNTTTCSAARSFLTPRCPPVAGGSRRTRPCNCTTTLANPAIGKCSSGDLTLSTVSGLLETNGANPTAIVDVHDVVSSCVPQSLLRSLPSFATGVAGLARADLALPSQLFSRIPLEPQFAICLPSDAAGAAFFGRGPFELMPPTPFDATAVLAYTPLVKHPINPAYYLDMEGIAVGEGAVQFLARMLEFDCLGHGGVMMSTAAPYTALISHIYRPFLKAFVSTTKGIPRTPKVKPFDLCLNSSALGSTRLGYLVPPIDLMLPGGKNWTVFGANSMKQVSEDTACLAFVDAGPKAEQAVVIGGFQMENNFLLFDVGGSRLGFSSNLNFVRTSCGNFNFTFAA